MCSWVGKPLTWGQLGIASSKHGGKTPWVIWTRWQHMTRVYIVYKLHSTLERHKRTKKYKKSTNPQRSQVATSCWWSTGKETCSLVPPTHINIPCQRRPVQPHHQNQTLHPTPQRGGSRGYLYPPPQPSPPLSRPAPAIFSARLGCDSDECRAIRKFHASRCQRAKEKGKTLERCESLVRAWAWGWLCWRRFGKGLSIVRCAGGDRRRLDGEWGRGWARPSCDGGLSW